MPFTVVFGGNATDLDFNPLKSNTEYGTPVAISLGDKIEQCDRFHAGIEDAVDTLEAMDLHVDNPLYDRLRVILDGVNG